MKKYFIPEAKYELKNLRLAYRYLEEAARPVADDQHIGVRIWHAQDATLDAIKAVKKYLDKN